MHRQRNTTGLYTEYLVVGVIAVGLFLLVDFLVAWTRVPEQVSPSYPERLTGLLANVQKTSSEVDHVLAEVNQYQAKRSQEVDAIYDQLDALALEGTLLRQRVEDLQAVDEVGARYMSQPPAKDEGRSGRSGYGSFIAGAIAAASVGIALRRLRGGWPPHP